MLFRSKELEVGGIPIGQAAVTVAKAAQGDHGNSRGCTQIKDYESYARADHDTFITSEADLMDPAKSAYATMLVLADIYRSFKKDRQSGNIDAQVTLAGENGSAPRFEEFIYYYYNGAGRQVRSGTATPEESIRNREFLEYLESITVYTHPTDSVANQPPARSPSSDQRT